MGLEWKLRDVLAQNKITVYKLAEVSGVPRNTLYKLANNKPSRIDLGTFEAILTGLDSLVGKRMSIDDLLERR